MQQRRRVEPRGLPAGQPGPTIAGRRQAPALRAGPDQRLGRFLRRYAYVRRANIEAFAQRFAELVKAGAPPRDPFALLPQAGIAVERGLVQAPLRGRWARRGGGYVVTVSAHEQPPAQAFAAWRETFLLLAAHRAFPTALTQVARDRLANRFASEILMPADAVLALARRFATNREALVEILAQRCGASVTAMRRRLYELEILRPRSREVHLPLAQAHGPGDGGSKTR